MPIEDVPGDQKSKVYSALQKRGVTPQSKDAREKIAGKKAIADSARGVLGVLDRHLKGEISDQDFQDSLNYVSSEYNKRGFGEGGKNLTANEQAVISGSQIRQSKRVPTWLDKVKTGITGQAIPESATVADDEKTLRNKMELAIKSLDTQMPSVGEGTAVKAAKDRAKSFVSPSPTTSGGKPYTPPAASNPGGDLLSAVGNFFVPQTMKTGQNITDLTKRQSQRTNAPGDIVGAMKNAAADTADLVGTAIKPGLELGSYLVPFGKGANLATKAILPGAAAGATYGVAQSKSGNEVHDAVTGGATGAAIAGGVGLTGKAGKFLLDKATGGGAGKIGGAEGRLLTSIAAPDPESVTRSEKLMKTALSITKSNSSRGMSKELEAFIPKATAEIKTHVANIDKQIGMQPVGEVTKFIEEKLLQSPAGQARPELVKSVLKHLTNQITAGELPGGMAMGEPFGTTLTKLNQGRLFLNHGTGSWFERGRPLQSDADMISALSWDASTAIKELMAQADDSGTLQKILDLQHAAIEVSPALAKQALKGGSGSYGLTQTVIKAIKAVLSPAKVAATRQIAKGGNKEALARQLMSGAMPTPEQIAPANQMPSYSRP